MKKVLFISYYWPPSGKASLHWPLKIIKHLPDFDWLPIVLTVTEDSFSQRDETFINEIPADIKVIRAKTYEPFSIYKSFTGKGKEEQLIASETISKRDKSMAHRLSVWIRMNLFIPDARVGWYFPAVKKGLNILKDERIKCIVSVGPPHTTHLIGKKLSAKKSLPHIPVFIDPWIDISYYRNFNRSKITLAIDNRMEKLVLKNSSAIVFVTETMKNDYEKKYPFIEGKSNVLYWGYSEEDFRSLPPGPLPKEVGVEKVILHAGNIFSYQNPLKLWAQIKKEIDSGNKLKLKFVGTVDPSIKESIAQADLNEATEYAGFLPYKKMLGEVCNADFLLVCATEPRHVPGKLFEYLRAGKPIIVFGERNNEVKEIIKNANAGMMFGYEESGEEFFNCYTQLNPKKEAILVFERKKTTAKLSELLNTILK